jgi:hypothetical protein
MNDAKPASRSDEHWIQDYLAGRLSKSETEEFESRCFNEAALGHELEQALEIRAALQPSDMHDKLDTSAAEQALRSYLAGKLTAHEADAFEERLFANEALAQEAQLALEVRAALVSHEPVRAAKRVTAVRQHRLLPLALAATIASLAVAIYFLQAPRESVPVFRGVEQRMGLEVALNGRALNAKWQPVSGATGYELRVFERSGELLRSVEVDGATAAIDLDAEAGTAPAFVDVVALDRFGQELIRSQQIALSESSDAGK